MTSRQHWTASRIATWKSRAATWLSRFVFYPLTTCLHVATLVPVLLVLVPWLALDFLPKRGLKQSTSPPQPMRKLPILLHEKGAFFAINPDGSKVEIDPLLFSEHFRQCSSALAAAMVYEKTRVRLDESA
jgi:hypothetical protein